MATIGYWILTAAGGLATVIPPLTQIGNTLDKNTYIPNVGIPVLVGLIAFGIGVLGLSYTNYNEILLFYLILALLMGSILISLFGSMIYATRLRYATG